MLCLCCGAGDCSREIAFWFARKHKPQYGCKKRAPEAPEKEVGVWGSIPLPFFHPGMCVSK